MKEYIEELVATYQRRVNFIELKSKEVNDNLSKVRLAAKKSIYLDVIKDLQLLIKDGEEN